MRSTGENRMHVILAELPFLEQIGSCALCGIKLPTLPDRTFDDRMFCGGDCTLLALHAGNEERVS